MKKILKIWGKVLSFILSHKIYFILALGVIIGTSYYFYHRAHTGAKTTYETAQVQKGMLVASVTGSGNVTVGNEAKINPTISGKVTSLKVALGDTVRKGQFLFYIYDPQMEIDLNKSYSSYIQAQQALDNAKAQQLQTQLDLASQTGDAAVKKAATALAQANQTLENAYSQVLQARADYNNLIAKQQTDPTSVSAADLAVADQKIDSAKAAYNIAKQTVATAKTDYDRAVANAGIVDEINKYKLTSAQTSVDLAQKNADTALASYDIEKDNASKRSVTSPIAGEVTTHNIKNGDTIGSGSSQSSTASSTSSSTSSNSTSSSSSANTPMVISDMSSLKAVVAINEADITKVAKDQKATLTFDAIPDLTLTGKVEKIDSSGTNSQNVITYSVTISMDSIDPKIKPQMNVSAAITTEVKQDVLIVANSAVKTSDNIHYVQILENGVPREQTVETGISNDTETEITSGLKEGDTVVTQTISAQSTSQATTRAGGAGVRIPGF